MAESKDSPARFIIWAPSFNETSGGAISLHVLCHRLNEAGETALLWPANRPLARIGSGPGSFARALRYALLDGDRSFSAGPFPDRLARRKDIRGAIVVYPEIVKGNPLGADHVVRWFLHRPGHLTGTIDYGEGELYFFILEAFNDPALNPHLDNKLSIVWFNPVYRDEHRPDRHGSCFLMRKEEGRALTHDLDDSVRIDLLTHAQKAEEFSRRRYFYSYDPYTMYCTYAAICGCIPIIVPIPGKTKLDWHPREEDRYGMAYGEDDIGWAIETRPKLLERLIGWRQAEDRMLEAFIAKCKERYGAR